MGIQYCFLSPREWMVFNKAHLCPPKVKCFKQRKQEESGPSPLNHTTNLQHSEDKNWPPSQSLVLTEISKIRTRDWEKKLEPSTIHLWHTQPSPGTSCDGSNPHHIPHSRKETTCCNMNSAPGLSYSKHKFIQIQDYRLEMGTQRKNKELGEKHRLSFVFWKHQEGTMKRVGKGWSWARTSPSLSLISPICSA